MRRIKAGKFWAVIDDADYESVSQFVWCARYRSDGKELYVYRYIRLGPYQWKKQLLHHFLLHTRKGTKVDHKDGNGLNNQRSNLRKATQQQNSFNQRKRKNASSKYKGVILAGLVHGKYQLKNKWLARIRHNNKLIGLGWHRTQREAAEAYNAKAKELFGEFANLNKIPARKAA